MKIITIPIIALLSLIFIPLVNAVFTDYNNSLYNKTLYQNHCQQNWSIDNSSYKNYGVIGTTSSPVIDNSSCLGGSSGCCNFTSANVEWFKVPAIPQYAVPADRDFTLICWVKYTGAGFIPFWYKGGADGASAEFALVSECGGGGDEYCFELDGGSWGASTTQPTGTGAWFMATGVYNSSSSSAHAYMNLTNGSIATGTDLVLDATDQMEFGRDLARSPTTYFTGQLDECAWFNKSLSSDEREFYYNLTKDGGMLQPYPVNYPIPPSSNTTTALLGYPINNTINHSKEWNFNFNISDIQNDNINFSVYVDTNSNPTTMINSSNNSKEINGSVAYSFDIEIDGSINGTYYWKVNGTDVTGVNFTSSIFTFNITNDINLYNITNVSITPLPLDVNTLAKCNFNLTNKARQNDTINISDQRWYVNNSFVATAGNTTLSAGNVTLNSNITCEARINTGYGLTSWTQYVNSSIATVGDLTAPTIVGQTINGNSFTTEQRVNATVNCTDNVRINYARVEWNRTGAFANDTMTSLGNNVYSYNSLFAIGKYNATNFYCDDGSGNIARDLSNFTFTVTSPPSGGSGTPSGEGGGGGTATTITIREGMPLLSFGGLTLIDFNVLTTPSKKVKIVRFKNVGNVTFANAKVLIDGEANRFINPFVCDLNLQNCINESINIKAGESMLLSLNGTFTEELGKRTSGVIKIQEQKTNGNTHELNLLVSRPPLYNFIIKPLSNMAGIPELLAFVIVYISVGIMIIGGIWFITL